MDFPSDKKALDIDDQYMFGKSILVCPVTESMYNQDGQADFDSVKERELYLPAGTQWIDYWTGEKLEGGQTINKETPIDIMPIFIKAGSVIPIGPDVQYAEEKPWDNLEIRIYEGADGEFTLYEDENDNYNYEKGLYSTIKFSWDNSENTLIISNREGKFPGMLTDRKFNIVIVQPEKMGAEKYDKTITYKGKEVSVKL
jgi:alpha-D-xyloside xylohydrolase